MKKFWRAALPVSLLVIVLLALVYFWRSNELAILSPDGTVAARQRNILVFATMLGMLVIVPVFFMTAFFAWRYRAGNKKANYKPDWDSNHYLEVIWWGIPVVIIIVLSIITWRTSHELDPYRPLDSDKQPVKIQVVALQWKWLFIYPEHNIATVNKINVPVNTPINFEIAADAPMNSFWIPKLGGQVYAMNGMVTKLHLQASQRGVYDGVSANISGEGFADMKFKVEATGEKDFHDWIEEVKGSHHILDLAEYEQLSSPGVQKDPVFYSSADSELYDTIVMKYMDPNHGHSHEDEHVGNTEGLKLKEAHQH